jgi:hypothetical protein
MPRIKKLLAMLGAVGVMFALSASSAFAFNSGTQPPGPPIFSGDPANFHGTGFTGRGALVCHQNPPQGGNTVQNGQGFHQNGPGFGTCGD